MRGVVCENSCPSSSEKPGPTPFGVHAIVVFVPRQNKYRTIVGCWQEERGASLRAETGLRLPDAIQLASAVAIHAFALVAHDRDFSAVRGFRIMR